MAGLVRTTDPRTEANGAPSGDKYSNERIVWTGASDAPSAGGCVAARRRAGCSDARGSPATSGGGKGSTASAGESTGVTETFRQIPPVPFERRATRPDRKQSGSVSVAV